MKNLRLNPRNIIIAFSLLLLNLNLSAQNGEVQGDIIDLNDELNETARVQVIHNSADAAAAMVDVWLDDALLIDNFEFRTATPFIDAPAGEEFTIAIQGPDSQSADNPIWSQNYTLEAGGSYILVAEGIVSASGYEPNQPFDIAVYPMAREMANMNDKTDVLVHHGSTDAPTVDVYETGVGMIVDNLSYGEFAGYLELPTTDYMLEIRDETGQTTVASYDVPLNALSLDGAAVTLIASGFLSPENNSNGAAFSLFGITASGDWVDFGEPMMQSARVQVIHNSADAAAAMVDVWLDDALLIDNFEFRTATPFIDAPAGEEFTIAIQGPDSQSADNPIWSQNYTLENGGSYILVAEGIVSASGYEPNQPFDIAVYPMAREMANMNDKTDVLVHHGSTDAPTVDVYETGVGAGMIVDDLSYGEFAGYLELPTTDYMLEIRDETGQTTVASYDVPLNALSLDGAAVTLIASGFLSPENNSNGAAFSLFGVIASGDWVDFGEPMMQSARVQVIHNSADAAAAMVDVWLNDALLIDNFKFRTATPFIDAPAGEEFTIAIQGPDSQSAQNPIWSQNYTLENGGSYILVAEGIVSASGYEPNQPFDIAVYPMAREMANMNDKTDVLVHHGSTDAPTVDVYETGVGAGMIVDDLSYGEFAGYLELPTSDYMLEIRDETGQTTVASYDVPLNALSLDGAAVTLIASGFLSPENNSNGAAFSLFGITASGDWVDFGEPMMQSARVQVIHNSADAAAAMVDVWLNDALLIDNFEFRTATPFIDAPAGEEFTIAIQGPDSQSADNPIWSQNYTLENGGSYILVAEGIVSASGYEPNQPFDIAVYPMAREMANMNDKTDVLVHHGSTDAPTVDVYETGVGAGMIVDDLSYGEFAGYLELPTTDYMLEIRDETGQTTVASYDVPLNALSLDGAAVTLIASGFLSPENNSNGAAFSLFGVTASGDWVDFGEPMMQTARVQVIHNSADAAAAMVDVWLNDVLLIDNFEFRTATPFIDAPAGEEFTIAIQGPDSQSAENPIWSQNYTLEAGGSYILVAEGIVSASGYEPNQPFDIAVYPMAREMASMNDKTDVLVHHGSTDAPTVDVYETGVGAGMIVDDLSYGEFAGYLELPTTDYMLEIRDETGQTTVVSYDAPLASLELQNAAITVIASGFFNPAQNSNGPAFDLYVALASGGELIQLPRSSASSVAETISRDNVSIYPNPVKDQLTINLELEQTQDIEVNMMDLTGRTLKSIALGWQNRVDAYQIDVRDLPRGIYFLRVVAGQDSHTEKLILAN